MLNRRANERPSLIPSASRQRRETMIMAKEAFKHLLLKYCQREIRDGRDFCVAALHVLEFEQVATANEQAGDQLLRLVEDISLRSQREKDRLCRLGQGNFILMLPDTDKASAESALDRLAATLSGAKTHYHQKPLRASTTFRIAHSKDHGSNIESLLSALGLCLDDSGDIGLLKATQLEAPVTNFDNFAIWQKRYKNTSQLSEETLNIRANKILKTDYSAQDTWSHEEKLLSKFQFPGVYRSDIAEKIIKRTRILEELNHPGLITTQDFQFEDTQTLWITKPKNCYMSLENYVSKSNFDDILLDWSHQLLNILIYLQTLIPPIVPPPFSLQNLVVGTDNHLILNNFEADYLFACLPDGEQQSSNSDLNSQAIVSLGQLFMNLKPEARLTTLFQKLQNPLPKELDSPYKVRAALKPFEGYGKHK